MAKKKQPLIDGRTLDSITKAAPIPSMLTKQFLDLAKQAKKSGASCVNASFRFGDEGVGEGEYIPELMLRVRKP
jgi:hypothetical protein